MVMSVFCTLSFIREEGTGLMCERLCVCVHLGIMPIAHECMCACMCVLPMDGAVAHTSGQDLTHQLRYSPGGTSTLWPCVFPTIHSKLHGPSGLSLGLSSPDVFQADGNRWPHSGAQCLPGRQEGPQGLRCPLAREVTSQD